MTDTISNSVHFFEKVACFYCFSPANTTNIPCKQIWNIKCSINECLFDTIFQQKLGGNVDQDNLRVSIRAHFYILPTDVDEEKVVVDAGVGAVDGTDCIDVGVCVDTENDLFFSFFFLLLHFRHARVANLHYKCSHFYPALW